MARTLVPSSSPERTDGKNAFLTSAPNVTMIVSIFVVAIFAVVTQLLAASGAISLSTTLQLTMWLVALGFVVLLVIAYMFFRAFERVFGTTTNPELLPPAGPPPDANGHRDDIWEPRDPVAQKHNGAQGGAQPEPDGGSTRNPPDGSRPLISGWTPDGSALNPEDAWVPPGDLRRLEGSEYSVSTEKVFPDGCYLEPDSITQVSDTSTGQQVYQCRVVDLNSALKDRPHEAVVKILASQEPSQESMPRYGWVEFENLTITPYVTDQNPMWIRYSLRATALRLAVAPTGREQATWTVPPIPPPREPTDGTDARVSAGDAPSGAAENS
jgi:hypothetical protein